ncbi:MAG: gluconate 2-dehydrogenase subunit 3 family protein [Pseudoxanthomonas sp.]
MERRELLKMIAAATGAAMIGIPAFVHGQSPVPAGQGAFSDGEVAMLDEIAETILPRTDTPGAKDAGVGVFMARYVSDCLLPQDQAAFRAGLADLDKRAGGSFVALAADARAGLLRVVDAEARASGNPQPHYFTMMKQTAIFGFFTSEIGATQVLRYVAVPGYYDGDMPYEPGTPAWAT